jgi:hypothetical protein
LPWNGCGREGPASPPGCRRSSAGCSSPTNWPGWRWRSGPRNSRYHPPH